MKLSRKQRNALYRLPMSSDEWSRRYAVNTRRSLIKQGFVESDLTGLVSLTKEGKAALKRAEGP